MAFRSLSFYGHLLFFDPKTPHSPSKFGHRAVYEPAVIEPLQMWNTL